MGQNTFEIAEFGPEKFKIWLEFFINTKLIYPNILLARSSAYVYQQLCLGTFFVSGFFGRV